VARGTQHRKRRPRPNARVAQQPQAKAKRPSRPRWEEQLFFGRLRAHAKWMFVFLAAVFAISFVIFGVGSGSTGISDVLQNFFSGSSASGSSLSSLEKKTIDHPKDAVAWRAYATKLEQKNMDDAAITALSQYTTLKPKDEGALRELAGIYLRRASDWDTIYVNLQARNQALSPTAPVSPSSTSALGKALGSVTSPIADAVAAEISASTSNAYSKVIGYLNQRLDVYKKLIALNPKDAVTQYSLAQAAQDAGDLSTAVKAYKAFLKLAPADSQAATARQTLKQLEQQLKATAGSGSIGK
jgi:tetratricopeptide (TPR) repeat protein